MTIARADVTRPVDRATLAASVVFVLGFGVIAGALAFEHIGGHIPCALCLRQRAAYYIGVPVALVAFVALRVPRLSSGARPLLWALASLFAVNAVLGGYHAGAEWQFWSGPESCAAGAVGELASTTAGLLESLGTTRPPSCTDATFRMLGLSFAGWNAVASLGLALVAAWGALPVRPSNGAVQRNSTHG